MGLAGQKPLYDKLIRIEAFAGQCSENAMNKWVIAVGLMGTMALLAGLHHIVVMSARGTSFSNAFAVTCHLCHGDKYDGFGKTADLASRSTNLSENGRYGFSLKQDLRPDRAISGWVPNEVARLP